MKIKMAPVCVAGRLLLVLHVLFLMFLLFVLSPLSCHSLIVYERQQLIDIFQLMPKSYRTYETFFELDCVRFNLPPKSSGFPERLRWQTSGVVSRRRRRRRGKRAGIATRIKSALAAGCSAQSVLANCAIDAKRSLRVMQRSRVSAVCISIGTLASSACSSQLNSPRIRRRKADQNYLRSLSRSSQVQHESLQLKMALVNARSLLFPKHASWRPQRSCETHGAESGHSLPRLIERNMGNRMRSQIWPY